jgi:hypothetical protein
VTISQGLTTLNVQSCFVTGSAIYGIAMASTGQVHSRGTDVKGCSTFGIRTAPTVGTIGSCSPVQ